MSCAFNETVDSILRHWDDDRYRRGQIEGESGKPWGFSSFIAQVSGKDTTLSDQQPCCGGNHQYDSQ